MDSLIDQIEHKEAHRKTSVSVRERDTRKKRAFVRKMMEDFDAADVNKDGKMDFSEFVRKIWEDTTNEDGLPTASTPITLRQLRREFRRHDLDGDGTISRREWQQLAEKCFDEQQRQQ